MPKQTRKRKFPSRATHAQVVAVGTPVRLQKATSTRKPKPTAAEVAVVVAQEINPVTGFSQFLREYAVVGLAIGFIVGLQAQELVKSLVASFINPAFGLFFGEDLKGRHTMLHFADNQANFAWGAFVYALLNFVFVLAAIYIIVKLFKLDKFQKASPDDVAKIKAKS